MYDQTSLSPENRGTIIRDILDRLHKVKVMLWAFDYPSAYNELTNIQSTYSLLLKDAKRAEKAVLEAKKRFKKTSARTKQDRFSLEHAENVAIANALQSTKLESFDTDDFAISAIARTIEQYSKKIKLEDEIQDLTTTKTSDNQPESSYKVKAIISGINKIIYRAYILEDSQVDVAKLKIDIAGALKNNPVEIEQSDTDFPFLLRFFLENALVEIAFLDKERWITEITHGDNIKPDEILLKILNIVEDISKK